uniref:Putative secreted protein n=1 Tax=Anopheles triannulatus TaxID=58253 RepID=A0A2M4B5S0_9DIPT
MRASAKRASIMANSFGLLPLLAVRCCSENDVPVVPLLLALTEKPTLSCRGTSCLEQNWQEKRNLLLLPAS